MLHILFALATGACAGVGIFLQKRSFNKHISIKRSIKSKTWLAGTLMGVLSFIFYVLAFKYGPITIVQPITNVSILVAAFLGITFLQEQLDLKEAIGFIIMFMGVIMLVIM